MEHKEEGVYNSAQHSQRAICQIENDFNFLGKLYQQFKELNEQANDSFY